MTRGEHALGLGFLHKSELLPVGANAAKLIQTVFEAVLTQHPGTIRELIGRITLRRKSVRLHVARHQRP